MLTTERMKEIDEAIQAWNCRQSGEMWTPLDTIGTDPFAREDAAIRQAAQDTGIDEQEIHQFFRQRLKEANERCADD